MTDDHARLCLSRRELLLATAGALLFGADAFASPLAPSSTQKRLVLRNANTGETFSGPYRDATGPIPESMADLAILLRDHRVNKVGPLDIRVLDFLADVMAATGQARATVLSGYRTHSTNKLLIAAGFSAAEKSEHLRGHALDVAFEAKLEAAAKAARAMKRGGVGFYPRSAFIHLDSGPVRDWDISGKWHDTALLGIKPAGPLSVRDRMKLHRKLAKKQWLARRAG